MPEMNEPEINEHLEVEDNPEVENQPDSNSELAQLRAIVFGAAKSDIDANIEQLRSEMNSNFEQIKSTLKNEMHAMHSVIKENIDDLDDRITLVDSQHDQKNAQLSTYADKLAAEIEINDSNSLQQDDEIKKQLEHEVEQLTEKFTKQHNQTIDLLNQVKTDLNSSKTDRKTLAKLLSSVASNLETDDF